MFLRALSVTALIAAFSALLFTPGPSKASGPVSLFQWEDYMDPPFLAEYKKQFHEEAQHRDLRRRGRGLRQDARRLSSPT